MTLLVTGFGPFPGVDRNPSGQVARALADAGEEGLVALTLPTEFERSFALLDRAVREHAPDALLLLGVAETRPTLCLERFALNWIEDGRPDAAGVRLGRPVVEGADHALPTTLPLDAMAAALRRADVPFAFSSHAGTYVCNCLLYRALHAQAAGGAPVPTGFVHVPMTRDLGDAPPDAPTLEDLVARVRVLVESLRTP
ncbi:MAG: pyroglutamyl-peptidase I [Myxococcota bacterium]